MVETDANPPGHAIQARGLEKTYPGGVRALDGLTFSVEAGTIFGLLGPNGAGKSTAVKILTTLSRADRGEARVAGLDVAREAGRVRHAIGVVGQKRGFDQEATGRENLAIIDRGRIVVEGTPDQLKRELHGDTVQIELAEEPRADVAALLATTDGLEEPSVDGRRVGVRAKSGAAAIPALITALEQAGETVATAALARPSLDDVYLRHAGRAFQEADAEAVPS